VQAGILVKLGLNLAGQLAVIRRFAAGQSDGEDAKQQNYRKTSICPEHHKSSRFKEKYVHLD
jgi:hypothetical protein